MSVRFVKASEIAERFRVSRDAVYLWIRQGKIPSECVIRIAGTVRVNEEEFERRLRSGDLYRRLKPVPGLAPRGAAEDNVTVKREAAQDRHRWTDEAGFVRDDHPNGPDMLTQTADG
jgi:excisionase family DNA binding protein